MPVATSNCPGCRAESPVVDGPVHRYIGASAACWAGFGALQAGVPELAPFWIQPLVVDAYAAQHRGVESAQALQSVAVHLVTLDAVLTGRRQPAEAVWVRTRAVERSRAGEMSYRWLEPQPSTWSVTLTEVMAAPTATERAGVADRWIRGVLEAWSALHAEEIAGWTDMVLTGR